MGGFFIIQSVQIGGYAWFVSGSFAGHEGLVILGSGESDGQIENAMPVMEALLRQYPEAGTLMALIVIFHIASGGKMITPSNFQNLLSGNAY